MTYHSTARYHPVNWHTWKRLVKVDLVLSTVQNMHDLAPSSTRNLTPRSWEIGNYLCTEKANLLQTAEIRTNMK